MRNTCLMLSVMFLGCTTDPTPPSSTLNCPQDFLDQGLPVCEYLKPYNEHTSSVIDDICSHLPAVDDYNPACTVACDYAAVAAMVPVGECKVFSCSTTTAELFFTGACN